MTSHESTFKSHESGFTSHVIRSLSHVICTLHQSLFIKGQTPVGTLLYSGHHLQVSNWPIAYLGDTHTFDVATCSMTLTLERFRADADEQQQDLADGVSAKESAQASLEQAEVDREQQGQALADAISAKESVESSLEQTQADLDQQGQALTDHICTHAGRSCRECSPCHINAERIVQCCRCDRLIKSDLTCQLGVPSTAAVTCLAHTGFAVHQCSMQNNEA